ncbi:Gar1/Naf1 RNA binding region-domain-containing protein [Pilobolus umbonatus]|nr:Gar1/Naf1 RNA binding region-domain-containing protein [Pilobolus umbonatus]
MTYPNQDHNSNQYRNLNIPDDIRIVSQYAQVETPIQPESVKLEGEIHIDDFDMEIETDDTVNSITKTEGIEMNTTDTHPTTIKAEKEGEAELIESISKVIDNIDAAIKGEVKEGYESSDLDLSSDEDESDSSKSDDESNENDTAEYIDEDEEIFADGKVKTANELIDFTIEKPNIEISLNTQIILAGHLYEVVDNVLLVHARPESEYTTLDEGSLLVYENREVVGEIFETFGPIDRPFYSVRYNNKAEINSALAQKGSPIFYVPTYEKTHIVKTEELKKMKFTDASNMYDEEVDEKEMEFSDDEQELAYRQQKNKDRKMKKKAKLNHSKPNPKTTTSHALSDDFSSYLAAYESSTHLDDPQLPSRQQQNYSDMY